MAIAYHRLAVGLLIALVIVQALAVAHGHSTGAACVPQASPKSPGNFNLQRDA